MCELEAALAHTVGQDVEHPDRILPADAGVGDADAVRERLAGDEVLPAFDQVGFHHDAEDTLVPCGHLTGDILHDVEAGHRAGCRAVLIDNGNETEWKMNDLRSPDLIAPDLYVAAQLIAAHERRLAGRSGSGDDEAGGMRESASSSFTYIRSPLSSEAGSALRSGTARDSPS